MVVEPVSCGLNTRPNNIGSTSNLSALIMISGINCTNPDWLFYSGTVAITDGGRTCQMWTEHTPHQHWFDQGIYFPNDNNSVENAENYCRTPDANDVPWCLTTDPHKMYQNCNNRICGGMKTHFVLYIYSTTKETHQSLLVELMEIRIRK